MFKTNSAAVRSVALGKLPSLFDLQSLSFKMRGHAGLPLWGAVSEQNGEPLRDTELCSKPEEMQFQASASENVSSASSENEVAETSTSVDRFPQETEMFRKRAQCAKGERS